MANLKTRLEEINRDYGRINAVMFGNPHYSDDDLPRIQKEEVGVLFDYEEACKIADFRFDEGYGGEEAPTFWVWTDEWVIVKGTYDGSEWWTAIPIAPHIAIKYNVKPHSIGV